MRRGTTAAMHLARCIETSEIRGENPLPHFELASFLAAAIGLLGFVSLCLLVFGRLGVGSIVAFLVAGLLVGAIRDLPDQSVLALREFAELGVILLLFLIGLEIKPSQLSSLGRDAISFGLPQITISAGIIGVYCWLIRPVEYCRRARSRLCLILDDYRRSDLAGSRRAASVLGTQSVCDTARPGFGDCPFLIDRVAIERAMARTVEPAIQRGCGLVCALSSSWPRSSSSGALY